MSLKVKKKNQLLDDLFYPTFSLSAKIINLALFHKQFYAFLLIKKKVVETCGVLVSFLLIIKIFTNQ